MHVNPTTFTPSRDNCGMIRVSMYAFVRSSRTRRPAGPNVPGNQFWTQNSGTVLDSSEVGDQMGMALTGGNFGKSGQADLAVGVPFEDVGAIVDAGAATVLYGSATSLTDVGNQLWTQVAAGGPPSQAGDRFGSSVG